MALEAAPEDHFAIPARIYTFSDLDEPVVRVITAYYDPIERTAYERVDETIGRGCRSLWLLDTYIWNDPKIWSQYGDDSKSLFNQFFKKNVLRCPKLCRFSESNLTGLWAPNLDFDFQQLAINCPKIKNFAGSLISIIKYVSSVGPENIVRDVTIQSLEYFENLLPELADLPPKLGALRSIVITKSDCFSPEYPHSRELIEFFRAIGMQLTKIWIHPSLSYDDFYNGFRPGINLEEMNLETEDDINLQSVIPERHPRLRQLTSYTNIEASIENLRILNRLPYLERVFISLERLDDQLLDSFRSFISCHQLQQIYINIRNHENSDKLIELFQAISMSVSRLKDISINALDQEFNNEEKDAIFNLFNSIPELTEAELICKQKIDNSIPIQTIFQLIDSCPKLNLIRLDQFGFHGDSQERLHKGVALSYKFLLQNHIKIHYPGRSICIKCPEVEEEDDDDSILPAKIYSFNDLNESLVQKIINYLDPIEKTVYERVDKKIGRCCRSVWPQLQLDLCFNKEDKCWNKSRYGEDFESLFNLFCRKSVFRAPNLAQFLERNLSGKDEPDYDFDYELLAQKCPGIRYFQGSLISFVKYVTFVGPENQIRGISITTLDPFDKTWPFDPDSDLMANVPSKIGPIEFLILKRLKMKYEDIVRSVNSEELFTFFRALGAKSKLISTCLKLNFEEYTNLFTPGSHVESINPVFDDILPTELIEKYPNIKQFVGFSQIKVSAHNLGILNRFQDLEKIHLYFPKDLDDQLIDEFREFLSCHQLKIIRIEFQVVVKRVVQMLETIIATTSPATKVEIYTCDDHGPIERPSWRCVNWRPSFKGCRKMMRRLLNRIEAIIFC